VPPLAIDHVGDPHPLRVEVNHDGEDDGEQDGEGTAHQADALGIGLRLHRFRVPVVFAQLYIGLEIFDHGEHQRDDCRGLEHRAEHTRNHLAQHFRETDAVAGGDARRNRQPGHGQDGDDRQYDLERGQVTGEQARPNQVALGQVAGCHLFRRPHAFEHVDNHLLVHRAAAGLRLVFQCVVDQSTNFFLDIFARSSRQALPNFFDI